MHPFYTFLKRRLAKGNLPGRTSQLKMAPVPVNKEELRRAMDAPPDAHPSSVLILVFPNQEERLELILTLRSHEINHGGQLSFPGGGAEQGESIIQTALREAKEEVGINPDDVKVAGQLSQLYVAHSYNHVTPVVGFLGYVPELKLNHDEVDEAFSVEMDALVDQKNLTIENWDLRDQATFKVPFWDVHRVPLWGATAMMLSEFLELYREFLKTQNVNEK